MCVGLLRESRLHRTTMLGTTIRSFRIEYYCLINEKSITQSEGLTIPVALVFCFVSFKSILVTNRYFHGPPNVSNELAPEIKLHPRFVFDFRLYTMAKWNG